VSNIAIAGASMALGLIVGRLSTCRQLRRLRTRLRLAQHTAYHDELTGLPNRALAAQVYVLSAPTFVVLFDLDRFKQVNDTYGHHIGDDLLRTIGERLTHAGSAHGGIVARLGGDEFLLLLPDDQDPAGPVEQILCDLAAPVSLHTGDGITTITPTASAGIADACGTFATTLHHADVALYHAKQQPGSTRTYQPDLHMPRNAGRHGPRRREQHPAGGVSA
jgi:diguanylate cyclase (GGDEF)-like protein